MKPAVFDWYRATDAAHALSLLAEHGDEAKPLAGGQSLIPAMNFRLARPSVLVDLNAAADLAGIETRADGSLRLGAMTRQRTVERSSIATVHAPLLGEAMPWVAHAQIRTRGTVGGSVAHGDPAAELPAVFVALGARYELRTRTAERWVGAEDFVTGLFVTALEPEELLTAIEIPRMAPRTGWAFVEMARRHGDFALAGVACTVTLDDSGRCTDARIALFGVGDGPMLSGPAASVLVGEMPQPSVMSEAAAAAEAEVDPPSDIHATAAYRRNLTGVLTRRALLRAVERTGVPS